MFHHPNSMSPVHFRNPAGLYDPTPNGYSHVAEVAAGARWILVAGQGGENPAGVCSPDFGTQVAQAIDNMLTALRAAGADIPHVARLRVLVVDHDETRLRQFGDALRRVWGERPFPACTLIPVPRLALDGMLFEIEATAALPA